jgi:predicted phosphodiesterase
VRLLCLSDVHGHADALAAVLATAERRGYDRIVVAGDLCFPGPAPLETWRRLSQAGAILVQGVGDRALATLDVDEVHPRSAHERARLDRLVEVRRELGELILARLVRLPTTARMPLPDGGELVVVHGSPVDPTEALSHDMSDAEILALVGDDPADVIICGGSHVPFDREVGGIRVINVGSVGEAPEQSGAGAHAHATFLEWTAEGGLVDGARQRTHRLAIEQFVVPLGKAA